MNQRIPLPAFNSPLLRISGRCPACNTPYEFQRLRILAERDQSILAYLECGQCATSVLSLLQMGATGLSTHLIVTDLTPEEVYERLDAGTLLSSDELIEFHSYLDNDNDLNKFIKASDNSIN